MYSFLKYSFSKSHVSSLCCVGENYYCVLSFVFYWEYFKTIALHGSWIIYYQHTMYIPDTLCAVRSTHKECAENILPSHVWTTNYSGPTYIPDLVCTYTYCITVRSALCCRRKYCEEVKKQKSFYTKIPGTHKFLLLQFITR